MNALISQDPSYSAQQAPSAHQSDYLISFSDGITIVTELDDIFLDLDSAE